MAWGGAGCEDPGYESESPDYLSGQFGEPTSGERGNMQVTEIGWAGSVSDEGVWDPDDVFVEFQNRHPRPINVSGWRLIIEGDQVRTHRLPTIQDPIQPNDFFVIAAKDDGAFQNADLIVPELKLGKAYVQVEFRDQNRKLIESAGSTSERLFTGGVGHLDDSIDGALAGDLWQPGRPEPRLARLLRRRRLCHHCPRLASQDACLSRRGKQPRLLRKCLCRRV